MTTIIAIVVAYLIGSLSTSILTAKFMKLPDPRSQGSGNAGATNMLRMAGKQAGLIVFVGDLLKGVIAVLIGRALGCVSIDLALVAFACVLGHVFPLYFKFRGGKGVATMVGSLIALSPPLGLATALVWAIVAAITRFSSLASLCAVVAALVYTWVWGNHGYFMPILFIAVLVVWKHRENIERLVKGQEGKINFKK